MNQRLTKASLLTLFIAATSLCSIAQTQTHSLGIRLGDPLGITYKQYLPNNRALEFIVGSAPKNWHGRYYKTSFDHFSRYDDDIYESHTVKSTISFQGRYLFHHNIAMEGPAAEGKLDWYWGVGGMLRVAKVRYYYQQRSLPFAHENDLRTDLNLGTDLIGGIEYTFEDIPLTLFADFSLFIEFADRPGAVKLLGGTGARLNF
jgi:hypothetical protein